ncbi:hAT family dimerization domain containing protein [Aphelenchoides avenae]|nr:hAT family dimerization domain containing protein [Aphelenchus avenae]
MSLATASSGAPDAKKFRFALPTQVVVNPLFDSPQDQDDACQQKSSPPPAVKEEPKPTAESVFKVENNPTSSCATESFPEDAKELKPAMLLPNMAPTSTAGTSAQQPMMDFSLAMLFQQANALFKQNSGVKDGKPNNLMEPQRVTPTTPICTTPPAAIPGALAVAASPAAQLFSEDDWSWHRNPAAAIRSGGTNKQTPVWKYFVYNKAENLSRCIIGDCTYMLKGPHTSTLACHLKKHPAEYAEFQKLKLEYSRERTQGQLTTPGGASAPRNKSSSTAGCTSGTPSAANSGSSTPTSSMHSAASSLLKNIKLPDLNLKLNGVHEQSPIPQAASNGRQQQPPQHQQQNGRNTPAMNDLLQMYARAAASFPAFTVPPNFPMAQAAAAAQATAQAHREASPAPNAAAVSQGHPPSVNGNPLFMNLVKNSLVPPAAAANAANELLQQTRKWQRQDRKQKELEVKLALMFSTAQLPYAMVKNPFFRDFMETIQPKFTVPEATQIDELINAQFAQTVAAVKVQLASASKFSLLIDVLKMNTGDAVDDGQNGVDEDESLRIQDEVRLCVSVAYFNKTTQLIDVALLGIRSIPFSSLPAPAAIRTTVEMLLYEYDIDMEKVSRVLVCGLEDVCEESCFPRELKPYNQKLLQSLAEVFEVDDGICNLKKSFYDMLINFTSRPESMRQLSKLIGRSVEFPITESFLNLAQYLLEIKEGFLTVCCRQPFDSPIDILTDAQWAMLEEAVRLLSLYRTQSSLVRDGNFVTIDRVVPSLMQMQMSLEKDFPLLSDLATRLKDDLQCRLAYILSPEANDFDGSFVQATALNPQLAMLLDENQIGYAKSAIEKLLYERIRHAEDAMARRNGLKAGGVDALLAAVVERKFSGVPPTSNASALSPPLSSSTSSTTSEGASTASSLYPDLMQMMNQRRKQNNEKTHNGKNLYAEAMVQAYFEDVLASAIADGASFDSQDNPMANLHHQLPPLQYWQLSSVKCAQLSEIAVELLSIPSCTVSLERIFSVHASDATGFGATEFSADAVIKAFDDPSRVERDAILRFNRNYIPKPY